jgi:polyhydroxybutyrate depolymerase
MAWPQGRDDVAFLGAVADDAARRFGLDRARIAASGFSAGGMMTWRLMCDAPDAYVAFAPVAGTLWKPIPARCAGPAPLLHVHGTADTVVPMAGRSLGGGRIVQGDLTEALAMLRASMGCAGPGRAGLPPAAPADWQGETWADCAGRGAITLLTHGGGHVAPRGWAEVALAFFCGPSGSRDPACPRRSAPIGFDHVALPEHRRSRQSAVALPRPVGGFVREGLRRPGGAPRAPFAATHP